METVLPSIIPRGSISNSTTKKKNQLQQNRKKNYFIDINLHCVINLKIGKNVGTLGYYYQYKYMVGTE